MKCLWACWLVVASQLYPDNAHLAAAASGMRFQPEPFLRAQQDASAARSGEGCALAAAAMPHAPEHFPALPANARHPQTPLGIALGRELFFDPRLSSTRRVSCASCHNPAHAFSTEDARSARGVSGRTLVRHTPALINLAWSRSGLFWDGGAKNLESLSLAPLTHEDELGRSVELASLMNELAADEHYATCFRAVFGPEAPKLGQVLDALAQYQRSLIFAGSRWDAIQQGEGSQGARERAGERVFRASCAGCHPPPLFTDDDFHNTGLDSLFDGAALAPTQGRKRITGRVEDLGKYKTPSLRDLGHSAPYMHDGRFVSLRQVIDHYRYGVRDSSTLDARFRSGAGLGLSLSDPDADELEAFLHTLDEP